MIFRFVLGWLLKLAVALVAIALLSWPFFWPKAEQRGTWRSDGYGMVIEIGRFGLRGYQETALSCLPFFSAPAHRLFLGELADITLGTEGDRLAITVEGNVNPIMADRIDSLPVACAGDGTPSPASPRDVFDIAWAAMDENYPFFDLYGVDWQSRRALGDSVTDPDSLWIALTAMLDGLDDGHTYVFDPETGRGFSPARDEDWADQILAFREVPRRLGLLQIEGTGLEYTILDGNIGYVFLRHMGTDPGLGTTEAELATLGFQRVADALSGTRAIILDNRLNPGGSDTVSLAYAGFFATEPYTAFTKETRNRDGYTSPFAGLVTGSDRALSQPVYLLNSEYTASAAEIFAMAMQELPHVTLVGAPTAGNLSDILDFSLPNGWSMGLSHQIYRDTAGTALEGTGVAPDILRPFDADSFGRGQDPLLEELRQMIGE